MQPVTTRLEDETLKRIDQKAEENDISRSEFLNNLINKALSSGDDVILTKNDLSETHMKKFLYWMKARQTSTLKDLLIESINRGLGLSRWGD